MKKRQLKAGDLVYVPPRRDEVGFRQGIFLRNVGKPLFNDGDFICHVYTGGEVLSTIDSSLKLMDKHGNLLPWKTF